MTDLINRWKTRLAVIEYCIANPYGLNEFEIGLLTGEAAALRTLIAESTDDEIERMRRKVDDGLEEIGISKLEVSDES